MTQPLLKVSNLKVAFDGVTAADGANVTIAENEFVAIIGPNGAGKTTFLNLCTGYVRPSAGDVFLRDRNITRLTPRAITRLGIARAFQLPQLFTDHSIFDNVLLAIAARRGFWQALTPLDRDSYREEAQQLLELVGLAKVAAFRSTELSEGMRKLADIVLAMALKPQLLLMDEPTSGVSSDEKFDIMETIVRALRAEKVAALFVEHDMEIVRRYADRVLVWNAGRVMAEGTPEDILNDPYVRENVVGVV
ncbi:MAG TPA: ABC transporter ATP-binding protein [Xanthobacteraceae bacterium]|nr:ABC transporter ATP-binding protein [Xanthobacteraceae bacterium]